MKEHCFKKYVSNVQPDAYERLFYPNYLTDDCSVKLYVFLLMLPKQQLDN